MISVVVLLVLTTFTIADAAEQNSFEVCPINHAPEFRCCDYGNGVKRVFTRYSRPDEYEDGWTAPRQVNFPEAAYFPSTPEFVYTTNSSNICRVVTSKVVDGKNASLYTLHEELKCTENSPALKVDSMDGTVFWTYRGNPRNNNASCPDFATFELLQSDEEKLKCVSTLTGTLPLVETYVESPLLSIYGMYAVFFVMVFLWTMYKKTQEKKLAVKAYRNRKKYGVDLENGHFSLSMEKFGPVTPARGDLRVSRTSIRKSEIQLRTEDSEIQQTGFQNSALGSMVFYSYVALTCVLQGIMMTIILDYYELFGTPIFGRGEVIMGVFMTVWFFCTFWLIIIVHYSEAIALFFRFECPLDECTHVYLFKPEHTQVMLDDASGVSAFVAKVQSFFQRKKVEGLSTIVPVHDTNIGLRIIEFQHTRYTYDSVLDQFAPGTVELGSTYTDIQEETNGLTNDEFEDRISKVGPNTIDITMPTILASLHEEFFSVFYVYQIMSYYVWFYFSYWNLGGIMVLVIMISAFINITTKRARQASIIQMTQYESDVQILRNGKWQTCSCDELVPGDVIRVKENWIIPCDLVVFKGSTVCDESMLTGESMPVQKFSIPTESQLEYDAEHGGKKYTLFAGAKVLSSGRNEEILAIVQTTGAHTSKGQLVRNILFPSAMRFKYDEHLKLVVAVLCLYSAVCCYFVVKFLLSHGDLDNELASFAYCIFIISVVVSPLLPVVITVGQVNASKRLEKLGVFCLNTQRLTLCGKIRVFCFDKTGTLTKEGLDFLGCEPVDATTTTFSPMISDVTTNVPELMNFALASCHAVGSLDGELVGNQVEVKMFSATGWKLIEQEGQSPIVADPVDESRRLQVVKRFEFDHATMTMSVVMRDLKTNALYVFCKGSYEKMEQLSNFGTLPSDYAQNADKLAREGCYVLGVTYRTLPAMNDAELELFLKDRNAIESDLSMLGLLLFRNELKPDTKEAIGHLIKGDTRVVMITGDNAMCGCYISRACGMVSPNAMVVLGDMKKNAGNELVLTWHDVDTQKELSMDEVEDLVALPDFDIELAVTGKAFDHMVETREMEELLLATRIYSRMTPNGKVKCVQMHMEKGAITAMCGDGGNDCGALRAAHAGIALSDAEASIVSPFTSKLKTITSVVDLCREGRCSVATSFASVKTLIMYGFAGSFLRLFTCYHGVILSEWCFVLMDGVTLVLLSYAITLSKPLDYLGPQRPTSSLVGSATLFSMFGQQLINMIILFLAIAHLKQQSWYCPFSADNIDMAKWWLLSDNAICTCLFFIVVFQQQLPSFVFSLGSQYRKSVLHNKTLVFMLVVLFSFNFFLLLAGPNYVSDIFRMGSSTNVIGLPDIPLTFSFRLSVLWFGIANIILVFAYEFFVIQGPIRNYIRNKCHTDRIVMKL